MKNEKSFPSLRRIPLLLSALFLSSLILLACGGGGGSSSGGSSGSGSDGGNPVDETFEGAVTLEINGGAARTGQRRVNLSVGIADPGAEVVAYLVSASSASPEVSDASADASADASSDVVFDVWRNVDPTADTFVESYLDATLDSSAYGTQTLHLWFKDSSGKLSDRGSDSIVLYSPAGRVRDAGTTACFNATVSIACPADASADFFGQDAQYDGLISTYTTGAGLRAGTVRDNLTGLVWNRSWGSSLDMTFAQLEAICANLDLGGYDDWRLSTAREAQNLVDHGLVSAYPAPFSFPAAAPDIWTRTPLSINANRSWIMGANSSRLSISRTNSNGRVADACVRGVSRLPFDYAFTARGTDTTDSSADDTVVESRTGLIWDRRETTARNWQDALAYCADSTHDGKTDWRLSSMNELLTLVDYDDTADARIDPAFDGAISEGYWSSTTFNSGSPATALFVFFSTGVYEVANKENSLRVRCVTD